MQAHLKYLLLKRHSLPLHLFALNTSLSSSGPTHHLHCMLACAGEGFDGPVAIQRFLSQWTLPLAVGAASACSSHIMVAAGCAWAAHSQAGVIAPCSSQQASSEGVLPIGPSIASAMDDLRRAALVQAAAPQTASPPILHTLTSAASPDRCVQNQVRCRQRTCTGSERHTEPPIAGWSALPGSTLSAVGQHPPQSLQASHWLV